MSSSVSLRCSARLWLAIVALSALAGCGGEKYGRVSGRVLYEGKPIANGNIRFEAPGKRPSIARIVDGQILDATTFNPGDGVPVGSHKVAISASDLPATAAAPTGNPGSKTAFDPNYMSGKSPIPKRYRDPDASRLTADIHAGENVLEFNLSSKP